MADHREIVADQEIGDAGVALQVAHQVEHLRLDRDVERRDRLVRDDQLGARDQRPRDGDALALAAGEFVRIFSRRARVEADGRERLGDARVALGA